MRKCSIEALDAVLARLADTMPVYLPTDDEAGNANYKKWQEGVKLSDALNTVRSAKDFFFPQMEDLVEFKVDGKNIEVIDTRCESEDFVIFGVRGCDVKSFDVLDRVFLKEPVDSYYASRRAHAVIVSAACARPSETCFCKSFGIDATEPEGDVVTWKENGEMYFEAKTEKGNALMAKIEDLTCECARDAVEAQKEKTAKIMAKLPLSDLPLDKFGSGKTKEYFDSEKWKELSQTCLGCGTCTFVCPTCQCYDIKDFNTGKGVIRFRCWDSCMYSDFTKMSAGQPRLTQLERFRQRFMHKLVYYPENNGGMFSCVGCGRCLAKCPVSTNIVKVMKSLGGDR